MKASYYRESERVNGMISLNYFKTQTKNAEPTKGALNFEKPRKNSLLAKIKDPTKWEYKVPAKKLAYYDGEYKTIKELSLIIRASIHTIYEVSRVYKSFTLNGKLVEFRPHSSQCKKFYNVYKGKRLVLKAVDIHDVSSEIGVTVPNAYNIATKGRVSNNGYEVKEIKGM